MLESPSSRNLVSFRRDDGQDDVRGMLRVVKDDLVCYLHFAVHPESIACIEVTVELGKRGRRDVDADAMAFPDEHMGYS